MGIGNPGRRDDGLGPACVAAIEAKAPRGVHCDANYQLNLEDAQACSAHDVVVFVDAADTLEGPYSITPLEPNPRFTMSTHSFPPEAILAVCEAVFRRKPRAYLLAIRGHRWEIGEGLSPAAKKNLATAVESLLAFIEGCSRGDGPGEERSPNKEQPCRKKKSLS